MSGDGLVDCAALVAADLVRFDQLGGGSWSREVQNPPCSVSLTWLGRHDTSLCRAPLRTGHASRPAPGSSSSSKVQRSPIANRMNGSPGLRLP
jgi:hypothetical protein